MSSWTSHVLFCWLCIACSLAKHAAVQQGRICAFGDFNADRYTDIIAQHGSNLTIMLQDTELIKNVLETGVFRNLTTFDIGSSEKVECSLGDFNGDSLLDVLVSVKDKGEYKHSVYVASKEGDAMDFTEMSLPSLGGQAMSVDVNGDGLHDVLGFFSNGSMYCQRFDKSGRPDKGCANSFRGWNESFKPYPDMPHIYADIVDTHCNDDNCIIPRYLVTYDYRAENLTGRDLLSEFVFLGNVGTDGTPVLGMEVWSRRKDDGWMKAYDQIEKLDIAGKPSQRWLASPLVADFDQDSLMEIIIPVCSDESCITVTNLWMWNTKDPYWNEKTEKEKQANPNGDRSAWLEVPFQQSDVQLLRDEGSRTVFRVGDFNNDGYPDLVTSASHTNKGIHVPFLYDNKACGTECSHNMSRKFQYNMLEFVESREQFASKLTTTAFFDLKEDGILDFLYEYQTDGTLEYHFSFHIPEKRQDTTFLKVQAFTAVCGDRKACNPEGDTLGSGIAWGGVCMSYSMSDGWGGSQHAEACQLPVVTHRALAPPYVLWGLGRSPNFVDEMHIGLPRYSVRLNDPERYHTVKQIVPNSRLVVMPPEWGKKYWVTRLYVTPSELVLQSLVVMFSVCSILLLVVAILHYREKKEDRVERQQQSYRFHFDAM